MTPLHGIIARRIRAEGPISVAEYMALCLSHPEHGYYITRDPLGRGGDFTTAPEISQMFGEMLGLWLAQAWMDRGSPASFVLAELGPGRGTLMADALRAALWRDLGVSLPRTAFAPCECEPTWEPSNPSRMTPTIGFAARAILTEITPAERIAEAVWVNPEDPHVGPRAPLTEDTILPRVVDAMGG